MFRVMVCMILEGSCLGRNGMLGVWRRHGKLGTLMKAKLELHMGQDRNVYDVKTCV